MAICPYIDQVVKLASADFPDLWRECDSPIFHSEQTERVRLDLLRRTETLDGSEAERITDLCRSVAANLEIDQVPIFVHQPQDGRPVIPRLCFVPDEIHLVVSPRQFAHCSNAELRIILGHEICHYWLWTTFNGQYRTTEMVLAALVGRGDRVVARETERRYRWLSELVCDRHSLQMESSLAEFSTAILKLQHPDQPLAPSDLDVAVTEDPLAPCSSTGTHPSTDMRRWAAARWLKSKAECEAEVLAAVCGEMTLERLCLIDQLDLEVWTAWLLNRLVEPTWMRTDRVMRHCKLFFSDSSQASNDGSILGKLNEINDEGLRDYLAYLTLDILTVDRELEGYPLAWALEVWEEVTWTAHVQAVICKELKIGKRRMQQLHADRGQLLLEADTKHA
ncbi:MAG: hypothetical protein VB878_14455 [Pirellulaceae bacterium]